MNQDVRQVAASLKTPARWLGRAAAPVGAAMDAKMVYDSTKVPTEDYARSLGWDADSPSLAKDIATRFLGFDKAYLQANVDAAKWLGNTITAPLRQDWTGKATDQAPASPSPVASPPVASPSAVPTSESTPPVAAPLATPSLAPELSARVDQLPGPVATGVAPQPGGWRQVSPTRVEDGRGNYLERAAPAQAGAPANALDFASLREMPPPAPQPGRAVFERGLGYDPAPWRRKFEQDRDDQVYAQAQDWQEQMRNWAKADRAAIEKSFDDADRAIGGNGWLQTREQAAARAALQAQRGQALAGLSQQAAGLDTQDTQRMTAVAGLRNADLAAAAARAKAQGLGFDEMMEMLKYNQRDQQHGDRMANEGRRIANDITAQTDLEQDRARRAIADQTTRREALLEERVPIDPETKRPDQAAYNRLTRVMAPVDPDNPRAWDTALRIVDVNNALIRKLSDGPLFFNREIAEPEDLDTMTEELGKLFTTGQYMGETIDLNSLDPQTAYELKRLREAYFNPANVQQPAA